MRANRKDGVETRKRLLDAACGVFAAKGFEDASIAEICEDAGANVAAVNYHFGSKDALYVEVWRHTFETFMQALPDHVVVVVDEAYYEFVRSEDFPGRRARLRLWD